MKTPPLVKLLVAGLLGAVAVTMVSGCAGTISFRAPGMQDKETEVQRAQAEAAKETAKALVEALKAVAAMQRMPPAALPTPPPSACFAVGADVVCPVASPTPEVNR